MPVAVAAVALLVGGCGGGESGSEHSDSMKSMDPTMSMASPSAAGPVLAVTGDVYSFTPKALKASAGKATIRFTNKGVVEHDFVIKALGVKLHAQPGKTVEAVVTLKPGTYKSFCSVPGHLQNGMQGTLTVS
jgi:plastocyanin